MKIILKNEYGYVIASRCTLAGVHYFGLDASGNRRWIWDSSASHVTEASCREYLARSPNWSEVRPAN